MVGKVAGEDADMNNGVSLTNIHHPEGDGVEPEGLNPDSLETIEIEIPMTPEQILRSLENGYFMTHQEQAETAQYIRKLQQESLTLLGKTEPVGKIPTLAEMKKLLNGEPIELAKPEQEPVCDKDPYLCGFVQCQLGKACKNTLINTIPTKIFGPNLEQILNAAGFYRREWVGLTDEEIKEVLDLNVAPWSLSGVALQHVMDDARALEAKLKEKNT